MRQLIQHLGSGRTELIEVPAPGPRRGRLLVRAQRSLVSLGTERMLVEFGRAGWLSKARQQPEKFRAVLAKVRSEGLLPALAAVRGKLAQLADAHFGDLQEEQTRLMVRNGINHPSVIIWAFINEDEIVATVLRSDRFDEVDD